MTRARARRPRPAGPAPGYRGKVPRQLVVRPAQQQMMDRAEEQEGRVLAGPPAGRQIEEFVVNRHGPAQGPVQRRGGELRRVLEGPPQRLPVQHEPSLRDRPAVAWRPASGGGRLSRLTSHERGRLIGAAAQRHQISRITPSGYWCTDTGTAAWAASRAGTRRARAARVRYGPAASPRTGR